MCPQPISLHYIYGKWDSNKIFATCVQYSINIGVGYFRISCFTKFYAWRNCLLLISHSLPFGTGRQPRARGSHWDIAFVRPFARCLVLQSVRHVSTSFHSADFCTVLCVQFPTLNCITMQEWATSGKSIVSNSRSYKKRYDGVYVQPCIDHDDWRHHNWNMKWEKKTKKTRKKKRIRKEIWATIVTAIDKLIP